MFRPPGFLVVEAIRTEAGRRVVGFGLNPYDYVSVVAGRGKKLACGSVQVSNGDSRAGSWDSSYLPFGAQRTTLTA